MGSFIIVFVNWYISSPEAVFFYLHINYVPKRENGQNAGKTNDEEKGEVCRACVPFDGNAMVFVEF